MAIVTVAVCSPVPVGVKVMVNGWLPPGRIGEVGCVTHREQSLEPVSDTFGLPVRFRSPSPLFSTVKLTALPPEPTSTLPYP